MTIEKPEYKVVLREKNFELRQYFRYITANVKVTAEDRQAAANLGFPILANYIFGNNISKQKMSMTSPFTAAPASEKISMTAPVSVSGSGEFVVSFMMPSKYNINSLPQPKDNRISFEEHPQKLMAVIRFPGKFTEINFSRHETLLAEWMSLRGITPVNSPVIAGYDPPFLPGFLKHNEVLVEYMKG